MSETVVDLDAWAAASAEFRRRTGRGLTLYEYRDMLEASPQTPFLRMLLAAEYARASAEAEDCRAVEQEENQIAPRDQDNWHNGG